MESVQYHPTWKERLCCGNGCGGPGCGTIGTGGPPYPVKGGTAAGTGKPAADLKKKKKKNMEWLSPRRSARSCLNIDYVCSLNIQTD